MLFHVLYELTVQGKHHDSPDDYSDVSHNALLRIVLYRISIVSLFRNKTKSLPHRSNIFPLSFVSLQLSHHL